MTHRHDPELLIRAPELRHLDVLLETLRASEQDLLVECVIDGFECDSSPSQLAAAQLIDNIRELRTTIHRYRRRRLRALRTPLLDDQLF